MPQVTARITAVGKWAFAVSLVGASALCVSWYEADRTLDRRLSLAEAELKKAIADAQAEDARRHEMSLRDRSESKAKEARDVAEFRSLVAALAARVEALEAALAAGKPPGGLDAGPGPGENP